MSKEEKKLKIQVGFGTDRGLVREINEDSFCVFVPFEESEEEEGFRAVLGVADGMGGHKAGDRASHFITEQINFAFVKLKYKEKFGYLHDLALILKSVIREINRELYSISKRDKTLGEMGSTLTLGIIKNDTIYIGHVGDSRCYRIREGSVEQLTKDHSWVAEQLSKGVISEKEALNHPRHNVITQAIGYDPNIEPQIIIQGVKEGDWFVFCTDGLTNHVSEREIMEIILKKRHPQRACDSLIDLALERGGEDNITVVLGHVSGPLSETAEEVIAVDRKKKFTERAIESLKKFKKISYIFLILTILTLGFFGGIFYQKRQLSILSSELLQKSKEFLNKGMTEEAEFFINAVLKFDRKNKRAQELMKKVREKIE